ncbi:microtubule-associated protein tau isoform X3 [Hermetia illucens]|uniref:microtubule-associated protein tau isoform X3 n=1 Tax=Hermetia illucens TaxID=343691 RepID=UPI0018CC4F6D|nr:microtubule-associated protein tau isoform X3 [Hermetia illucens]
MSETDTIRGPIQQPQQFQAQRPPLQTQQPQPSVQQNSVRPNVNPVQQGVRPPPPPSQISGQPPTAVPQQRPVPLRRADSRSSIQPNQFVSQQQPPQQRPIAPAPTNQPIRPHIPPSGGQNFQPQVQQQPYRQQSPGTLSPQQSSNQLHQTRPNYSYPNQQNQPNQPQQNPQARPTFQRPPGQQQPPQFRAPYPQQGQQQRPPPIPQPQPVRNMQNPTMPQSPKSTTGFDRPDFTSPTDVNKMNALNNSSFNNNDDDDDVIMGKSSTPLKKPIDPMTQSQYGFLDNKPPSNGFNKPEEATKPPSNTSSFMASNENKANNDTSGFKSSFLENSGSKFERNDSSDLLGLKPSTVRTDHPHDNHGSREVNNKPLASFATTDSKPPISLNSIIDDNDVKRAIPQQNNPAENVRDSQRVVDNIQKNVKEAPRGRPPVRYSKGDNDSGVDESTQGNDRNGPNSPGSPLKSPTKNASSRPASTTPSTKSNISRSASRSRNLKTPEPEAPKKVPMNKVQVGHAPSPNLKAVRSKIGSLDNASYKPGGGNVKIETKKVEIKAAPRIEAKNDKYMPKGGDKKIISTKLQWNAKSKIGSLENAHHKPGGGDKKIETVKTDFKDKAKPKVGSKDNTKHTPGGGDIKANEGKSENNIQTHKLEIKAQSKIGSLDNVKHKPGGGDKKIFDDKDYLKNVEHPVAPTSPTTQSPAPPSMTSSTGADENLNQQQQQQQQS